mgnify:CR=1 FL=1
MVLSYLPGASAGTPTIDLLAARKDMKLVALFGPEHGIRGVANLDLTPELALRLGRAAGHVLGR